MKNLIKEITETRIFKNKVILRQAKEITKLSVEIDDAKLNLDYALQRMNMYKSNFDNAHQNYCIYQIQKEKEILQLEKQIKELKKENRKLLKKIGEEYEK